MKNGRGFNAKRAHKCVVWAQGIKLRWYNSQPKEEVVTGVYKKRGAS